MAIRNNTWIGAKALGRGPQRRTIAAESLSSTNPFAAPKKLFYRGRLIYDPLTNKESPGVEVMGSHAFSLLGVAFERPVHFWLRLENK